MDNQSTRNLAAELTEQVTLSVHRRFVSCCMGWDIACKPTARHEKGKIIPTATHNFAISTVA